MIKHRFFSIFISVMLIISFIPLVSFADIVDIEAGSPDKITMQGSGTIEDPYQIYTKHDLDQVRNDVDAAYILMNDIVFTKEDFREGGAFYNQGKLWQPFVSLSYDFKGSFDGNGYRIEGIEIGNELFSSIFGSLHKATIKDLTLHNVQSKGAIFANSASGSQFVNCTVSNSTKSRAGGGFVDFALKSTFKDCESYVCITDTSKSDLTGGIVGDSDGCTFYRCKNYGNINTKYCAGGIVGRTSNGYTNKFNGCENYGNITARDGKFDYNGAFVGGIVGYTLASDTIIKNSFNNGTIMGKTYSYSRAANAGGIAGQNASAIIECYNSGEIIGSASDDEMVTNVGGISGICKSTITNCFNSGKIKSIYRAGGIASFIEGANARISRCYNVGVISATEAAAGVTVKASGGATVSNAYYLQSDTTGKKTAETLNENSNTTIRTAAQLFARPKYGTGLTKKEMQKKSSFKNFNFSNKWTISSKKNYKYPTLKNVTFKPQVKVKSLMINYTTRTMEVGKSYKLKVNFSPSNTTNKLVKWTSSNPKIATVDSSGRVKALAAGTVSIACKTLTGKKVTSSKIYVVDKLVRVSNVNIVKSKLALKPGKTATLKMKASPSNASTKQYIWKTSNKKVVTVTSTGKIKAIKKGKATITCVAADGSGKKDKCVITVK